MSYRVLSLLLSLFLAIGCAAPLRGVSRSDAAPDLQIAVFRKDAVSGALSPWQPRDTLKPSEEAVVEIQVRTMAYVTAVLYAASGGSKQLTPDAIEPHRPGDKPVRVMVPRHAPPGVKESELRVIVAASPAPLPPLLRHLLRLPCQDDGGRGDPEPAEGKKEKQGEEKGDRGSSGSSSSSSSGSSSGNSSGGDSGKPPAREPRGGGDGTRVCASQPELTAPITVRGVLLHSE